MKFAEFKLYIVKALRIAFTTVAWLDVYCWLTGTSIFGFTRGFGNALADGVTAFLLFCWEDACYEEYCFKLAEDTMQECKGMENNLVTFRGGKKDDKNE